MALAHFMLGKFLGVVCHCFPPPLDVPAFAARCLYVRNDARDPSSERWNCGREIVRYFCLNSDFHINLGIFYMLQFYDMGPTALLPLRRKACWGIFRLKIRRIRLGLNPRTWVLKASTLPLDHRSRIHRIQYEKYIHLKTSSPWHYGLFLDIWKALQGSDFPDN